ncbi:MAG: hypothetical protein M3162_06935 [Thermoproteota archaeon]|nr:hypothetical protein [Thermoproteota archaeon]
MHSYSIEDIDKLLKKSYKELDLQDHVDPLDHKALIEIVSNFSTHFPDVKTTNPFITVLKAIASFLQIHNFAMEKNKLYDFLVNSYNFLSVNIGKSERDIQVNSKLSLVDNIVFEICNDILLTYDSYDVKTKIQFPNLVVDILSILFFKVDTYGKGVSLFQIKSYYGNKKDSIANKSYLYQSTISNKGYEKAKPDIIGLNTKKPEVGFIVAATNPAPPELSPPMQSLTQTTTTTTATIKHIDNTKTYSASDNSEYYEDTEGIVDRLAEITYRTPDSIRGSLSMLPGKEIRKLFDICNNYNKIIKYSQFESIKDFKLEIENELGRTLSDKQVRHSQISIKKVQYYIANILDGKFEPHLTHGINHVKHNFEYGYRLVGLIRNTKIQRQLKE